MCVFYEPVFQMHVRIKLLRSAEGGAGGEYIDFLSNGVKLRTTGASANGSANFVYMAFAEMPQKYSNAR